MRIYQDFFKAFPVLALVLGIFATGTYAQDTQRIEERPAKSSPKLPTDLRTRRFGSDWPQFLGPNQDSKSLEKGIIKDWSKTGPGLDLVWEIPLEQSYGTCTTSRGRLFQFDSEPVGSTRRGKSIGKVLCLKSETGERIWEYRYEYDYADQYGYNNGPRNSPIVDGDRVYAYGVDGRLICIDVATGEERWTVETVQRFGVVQNFFGVGSNPVVFNDLVIAMVGGSPQDNRRIDRAKGNGTGIVAFDKFTGKVRYQFSDELASYASLRTANIAGTNWGFAFARGGLLGFDPEAGKQRFFFPWRARVLESVNASVPVVFGSSVFISETYGPGSALLDVSRIKDDRPRVVWQDKERSRQKAMQTHWNTAILHNGYLYGSSGRHQYNAELRCIEAKTGKVMWSQEGLSRCSLLFVDDHFVCLSEVGLVLLIKANPNKFEEVSELMLRDENGPMLKPPAWAAPVLSHGLLYLRGDDRLVCLDLIPDANE